MCRLRGTPKDKCCKLTTFFNDHDENDLQLTLVQQFPWDVRTVQRASLAETFS